MLIKNTRFDETERTTIGAFCIDGGQDIGYILEPGKDKRIPAGIYHVKARREGAIYEKYKKRFGSNHPILWLYDVPGREWIEIHIGNRAEDTEGCQLPGYYQGREDGDFSVGLSEDAYLRLHKACMDAWAAGDEVLYEIKEDL